MIPGRPWSAVSLRRDAVQLAIVQLLVERCRGPELHAGLLLPVSLIAESGLAQHAQQLAHVGQRRAACDPMAANASEMAPDDGCSP